MRRIRKLPRMQGKPRFLATLAISIALLSAGRGDEFAARYQQVIDRKGSVSEAARLHQLFTVDWEYTMAVFPEAATWVGFPGHETEWTDLSREAVAPRRGPLS